MHAFTMCLALSAMTLHSSQQKTPLSPATTADRLNCKQIKDKGRTRPHHVMQHFADRMQQNK